MCGPRSPATRRPVRLMITIELPKTSTGKIQKFILRDKEWAGHGQRVKGSPAVAASARHCGGREVYVRIIPSQVTGRRIEIH